MDAIRTVGLSKSYNNTLVLNQLNLDVKKGEVYGFIGKNGAGKTTTINLILSLIMKDSGQVFINENEVKFNDLNYKKLIGYVPDVPVFPSYMCAKDYLRYTLDIFNMGDSSVNHKIEEVLEFVSLPNTTKKISSYSRGMKQRLAIAQALIHEPDIIIMDEPTSALDPIGRNDVMNIIYKLRGSKTIFYSTHILDDVERVCDRIGLLDNGNLIVQDTIENIQARYFSNKFYIETKNEPKIVLKKVNGMKLVQNAVKENHGIVCYIDEGISENMLLKKLMELDEDIVEFRRVKTSLEDVFIRMTNEKTT